jgi:hypothetical protein
MHIDSRLTRSFVEYSRDDGIHFCVSLGVRISFGSLENDLRSKLVPDEKSFSAAVLKTGSPASPTSRIPASVPYS